VSEETDIQTPVPERPQADEKFALNPNESRFLFVEVAAQRAKQLRRGALNRLAPAPAEDQASETPSPSPVHKPERVAMEEVRRGFIQYGLGEDAVPQPKAEER
jgi:DNA-directed RNA polymerase subunit K/omega